MNRPIRPSANPQQRPLSPANGVRVLSHSSHARRTSAGLWSWTGRCANRYSLSAPKPQQPRTVGVACSVLAGAGRAHGVRRGQLPRRAPAAAPARPRRPDNVLAYAGYNLAYAALSYPAGRLADRLPPRLVYAAELDPGFADAVGAGVMLCPLRPCRCRSAQAPPSSHRSPGIRTMQSNGTKRQNAHELPNPHQ